jgi:hypothetical protein
MSTSVLLVLLALAGLSLLGLIGLRGPVRRVVPKLGFVIAGLFFLGFLVGMTHGSGNPWSGFVGGICAAIFALSLGYVYGDAARRGMSPVLWTLIAFMVPNLVGFLLYFLLRTPLLEPCRHCGRGIAPGQAFCPFCGQAQTAPAGSPA